MGCCKLSCFCRSHDGSMSLRKALDNDWCSYRSLDVPWKQLHYRPIRYKARRKLLSVSCLGFSLEPNYCFVCPSSRMGRLRSLNFAEWVVCKSEQVKQPEFESWIHSILLTFVAAWFPARPADKSRYFRLGGSNCCQRINQARILLDCTLHSWQLWDTRKCLACISFSLSYPYNERDLYSVGPKMDSKEA